jgi:putative peptide zinc metalloprotease protein
MRPPLSAEEERTIPTPDPDAPTQVLKPAEPANDGDGVNTAQVTQRDDLPPPAPGREGEVAEGRAASPVPTLCEGIELIGEYEGSGFREAPYIARRGDGQVIQLPPLLYVVAEHVDGKRDYAAIAERVTETFGRGVSADNIRVIVEEKLRPLGVTTQADGSSPKLEKLDPMLALKFRAALVPTGLVRAITTVFRPLFFPPVVVAVLATFVGLLVWLFAIHGVAQSARSALYQPANLLILLGLVVLSAAFHECGHATACRYGGATPGVMGAGIYIVWPAFYTDVTDAYRLGKGGRLRTDLGGVYFNTIFVLGTGAAYALTGFEPLLLIIPIQLIEIVHQFLPFLRLDGYYIVSDMTGVPDMFARIKPTLKSLMPWKETPDTVTELKPWVRVATTIYVLTVIPVLIFLMGMMAINAPRIFATAWDSFFVQYHKVRHDFSGGSAFAGAFGIFQMLVLALPVLGIVVTFSRLGQRIAVGSWRKTEGRPAGRAGLVLATAAAAVFVGYIWWPNGDYRPIQPGERGTLAGAVDQFGAISTGRPGLTAERAQQLGGAPFKAKKLQNSTRPANPPPPASTTSTETPTVTTPTESTPTETTPGATSPAQTTPAQTATGATATTPAATTPTDTTPTDATPTDTTPTVTTP